MEITQPIYIQGNVYVISTKLLYLEDIAVKIISRVGELLEQCFGIKGYSKCGGYTECDSFLYVYFEDEQLSQYLINEPNAPNDDQINIIKSINDRAYNIKGVANVIVFRDDLNPRPELLMGKYVELYDVCTDPNYRGKGVASKILEVMLNMSENVWLGVKVSPVWRKLVKLYSRAGFIFKGIANKTPGGLLQNDYFFEMIWVKGQEKPDVKKTLSSAENTLTLFIIKLANYENNICLNEFYFSNELYDYMDKHYINLDYEVGGVLVYQEITEQDMIDNFDIFKYLKVGNKVIQYVGNSENFHENFEANPPLSAITFHTHPQICYINSGCHLGWPSGGDIKTLMVRTFFHKQLAAVLFTIEGMYLMALNPIAVATISNFTENCRIAFIDAVYQKFLSIEEKRKLANIQSENVTNVTNVPNDSTVTNVPNDSLLVPKEVWDKTFNEYNDLINSYTILSGLEDTKFIYPQNINEINTCVNNINNDPNMLNYILNVRLFEHVFIPKSTFYPPNVEPNIEPEIQQNIEPNIGPEIQPNIEPNIVWQQWQFLSLRINGINQSCDYGKYTSNCNIKSWDDNVDCDTFYKRKYPII